MNTIFIIYFDTVIYLIFVIRWAKYTITFLCSVKCFSTTSRTNVLILDLCCKLKYQHQYLIYIQLCNQQNIINLKTLN